MMTDEGSPMTGEQRLDRLEGELARGRRFNHWLLAGLGLCLGIAVVGWALPPTRGTVQLGGAVVNEVRARKFVLYDDNGKRRAQLDVGKDGPALRLCDEKGTDRAVLGTTRTVTKSTGVEHKLPPSSLTLFDEESTVIWSAPER